MFNLPDEVNEIILDYLSVECLLNASLVSKSWFQYIADSVPFRKKIIINSTFFSNPGNLKKRKYEALSIRQYKKDGLEELIKKYEWKSVYFSVRKISSQKDFVSLIKKLSHVRDLKVMNVAIRKLTSHNKLVLPELEHLVFSDVAVDTFETFMAHQPSLKSLSLRYLICDILNKHTAGEYVVEFLVLNSQLSELELYADVIDSLFKLEVAQTLSLKLRAISLNFLHTNNSVVTKNLQDFIKSQEPSLEELKILFQQKFVGRKRQVRQLHHFYYEEEHIDDDVDEECTDISILLDVWNNLSNLKKLTLRFFVNFVESEVYPSMFKNFKPNNNIKILNIQHINCTIPWRTIAMIINLCPNLNSLYISVLNSTVLKFCCGNLKLLRNLSYCIEKENAIVAYNAAINSGDNEINKFIKFHKAYNG